MNSRTKFSMICLDISSESSGRRQRQSKMGFEQSIQPYMILFYCIGFSSYLPPSCSAGWKFFKYSIHIQAFICDFFSVTSLLSVIAGDPQPHKRTGETILVNVFIVWDIIRATSTFLQCCFFRSTLVEISATFDEVNQLCRRQLHYRIPYDAFRRSYQAKIFACLTVVSFYVLGFFGRVVSGHYASLASHFTKLLQVMATFSFLHTILYASALKFHIQQLNAIIERDAKQFRECTTECSLAIRLKMRERLKMYKRIHFLLWTVSRKIGHYFGYSLIALFLHFVTVSIYSGFWCYLILKAAEPVYMLWCELTDVLFFCVPILSSMS